MRKPSFLLRLECPLCTAKSVGASSLRKWRCGATSTQCLLSSVVRASTWYVEGRGFDSRSRLVVVLLGVLDVFGHERHFRVGRRIDPLLALHNSTSCHREKGFVVAGYKGNTPETLRAIINAQDTGRLTYSGVMVSRCLLLGSRNAHLVQWLERLLDTQEVTGSSPVMSTLQ